MSNSSEHGDIEYEAETSAALWAEAVTTFATHRIPHIGPISLDLTHEKQEPGHLEHHRGAGGQWVLMGQGGSFKTKLDLTGHGATTAGSPTLDALETFLGIPFGAVALSASASTTLTGGTAAVPTTTASGTFSAGGLCAVGALLDGDGDGQMYGIATHTTTSLTLLHALRGAPVNGAVLCPVAQMYLPSDPTSSAIIGSRFQILTNNMQYRLHGCFPQALSFMGLSAGERPQLEITWGVSRWSETASGTYPSAVTMNRYNPGVVAAGSLHVNTVGTSTRSEIKCPSFQIDVDLGIIPIRAPGGVGQYQTIIGARRTNDSVKITFTADADSVTASPVLPGWGRDTLSRTMMYTLSTAIGSRVGFKFPKVCSSTVPVQIADGGLNRFRFEGMAYTGDTTTNDLTRSRMVMGYA